MATGTLGRSGGDTGAGYRIIVVVISSASLEHPAVRLDVHRRLLATLRDPHRITGLATLRGLHDADYLAAGALAFDRCLHRRRDLVQRHVLIALLLTCFRLVVCPHTVEQASPGDQPAQCACRDHESGDHDRYGDTLHDVDLLREKAASMLREKAASMAVIMRGAGGDATEEFLTSLSDATR